MSYIYKLNLFEVLSLKKVLPMAAIARNDAEKFMGSLKEMYPDVDPSPPNNAVMIMLMLLEGVWRVVMNVERRWDGNQWGFPGGQVDSTDKSTWEAAKRELLEETGHAFDMRYWDRSTEVKFTVTSGTGHKTRFYVGVYAPPNPWSIKGDPNTHEVVYVEFPRVFVVMEAFKENTHITCANFDLPFRPCMWRLALAFKD